MNRGLGAPYPATRQRTAAEWLPLLQDTLAQQGSFRLPLRGDSMRPTLPLECEIDIVPLQGQPAPGELIVFVVGDTLVAHRLVRLDAEFWIAQGDNRRGPDRPLRPEQVLGRVAAARVDGRQVWPGPVERQLARAWIARHQVLRAGRWVVRRTRRSPA